ncbi:MAG: DNA-3-methyladenine glycosylase 2 family protein [Thermoprotei archaeon]
MNRVDLYQGDVYRRILLVQGQTVAFEVKQNGSPEEPRLLVEAWSKTSAGALEGELEKTIRHMLGTHVDLTPLYERAEHDARLLELVRPLRGLKPPRFPTMFETLANAVACQQVSLEAGLTLVTRLSQKFGSRVRGVSGFAFSFPSAEKISKAAASDIRALGFSASKAETMISLARAQLHGELEYELYEKMGDDEAIRRLDAFKGIGRWSAEYTLLRGLGRLDIYPGDDVGAAKSVATWLNADHRLSYEEVKEVTSNWGPLRGAVYFHFLLRKLKEKGLVN